MQAFLSPRHVAYTPVLAPGTGFVVKKDPTAASFSGSSTGSIFGMSGKRALQPNLCYAGGRGLTHAVIGAPTVFSIHLVDANYMPMGASPALLRNIDVDILQARKPETKI